MATPNSSVILTPADFADTGQWRLVIYVSHTVMCGVLRHISDISRPAVLLFHDKWPVEEGDALLKRIETCVYDHPSVLDDYATEVVVEARKLTWVPSELLGDGSISPGEIFATLFPEYSGTYADLDSELMTDPCGEMTAIYAFTPGFDGFMARTIPGARLRSHIGVLAEHLHNVAADEGSASMYLDLHEDRADMLLFDGDRMICGSVIEIHGGADGIISLVETCCRTFRLPPSRLTLFLRGDDLDCIRSVETGLTTLGIACRPMELTPDVTNSGLPLAAALRIFQK